MARTALTINTMSIAGISSLGLVAPNGAGSGNGNTIAIGGNKRTFLYVSNASAGIRTITIPNAAGTKKDGVTLPSQVLTVAATSGGIIWLGPLDYVDPTTGNINVDIDSVTSVTWAAVQMPENFQ